MTNNEILNLARLVLDDIKTPYLWKDDELVPYLSNAIREFATATKVIIDDETVADADLTPICVHTVDVDADAYTGSVTLHPCIIEVLDAWYTTAVGDFELKKMTMREANSMAPSNWRELTSPAPTGYILDKKTKKLLLHYIPSVDGTLTLRVIRVPYVEPSVIDPDATSELDAAYHLYLLDYILYRAYLKNDSETYNPSKATEHLQLFLGNVERTKREQLLYDSTTEYVTPLFGNL